MAADSAERMPNSQANRLMQAIAAAAALTFSVTSAERTADPDPVAMTSMRPIAPGDTVLVVAPHPDDESLCCGGLIRMARRAGAQVAIVWITNGDAFRWDAIVVERRLRPRAGGYLELARQRIAEARAAAAVLGVPDDSLYFLGYPDRGTLSLLFDYYYSATPWRSRFTGASAVAYEDAVNPGAIYTGRDLERDFQSVVARVHPTLVLAPSPQDTHPDHRAAGLLALRAMGARNELGSLRFWVVHGGHGWPRPRGLHSQLPPTVPPRGRGMQWEKLALDPDAIQVKIEAVRTHRTQLKVMGKVMMAYVRAQELYSRNAVPAQDLSCVGSGPCEFEPVPVIEKSGL